MDAGYEELAAAYSYLQKAVGLIAVTLPVVVIGGGGLSGGGLQDSISAYYYTHLGNYFVGSLFALGVFFLSYQYRAMPGFSRDNHLSTFASVMAIGVALCPTTLHPGTATGGERFVGTMHLVFAGTLFVLLAVFSLFLFTKTDPRLAMTRQKEQRNRVYRISGWTIVAALVAVPTTKVAHVPDSWHTFLWLESIMVVAFGVSWLIKGEFLHILADK
jgi:hypothetical protein